jgi:ATP-dependent DNA helicase RecG
LVEGRNTGIPSILHALDANGSPPPLFETDMDRSYFRITFIIHSAFISNSDPTSVKQVKRRKKAEVKAAVLEALSYGPLSSKELAAKVGYSTHRSGAFYRVVSELAEEKRIARTNPDHIRENGQKLYLTQPDIMC